MEIQELKDICQKFLKEHLGKNLEINDDSDETGLQVYSTLYEWNLNENQKGEISFWCSNGGWKSEDGAIKEDDVVCWLCLERYLSVTKEKMKDFLKTKYDSIYDDNCYEDECLKEKKLFIQVSFTKGKGKNTVFISYCFKNEKSNCDEEFYDFFKQLIDEKLISVEELTSLKESIVAKYICLDEDGNKNTVSNSYLQNIYDDLIALDKWNSNWFNTYEKVVKKFIDCGKNESWDEETLSSLIKNVENGISSLRQKNFEKKDFAKIKDNWVNIQPIVKRICTSTGVDENACGELSDFLYQNSREKLHSAVHRVIAAFLPNKVSTIVKKKDFDIVSKRLSEKFKDYPPITNDWLKDNINFIEYCNKNVVFKHPWHSSLFAWHLKNFFEQEDKNQKEIDMKMDEIVKLLENNHNIILHGAPGTGKTYLAKEIAKAMGCEENEIGFVQFHQSYDYTDFVEGLRPNSDLHFGLRPGVFKSFCAQALKNLLESSKKEEDLNKENKTFDYCYQYLVQNNGFEGNNKVGDKEIVVENNEIYFKQRSRNRHLKKSNVKLLFEYLLDNEKNVLEDEDQMSDKKLNSLIEDLTDGDTKKLDCYLIRPLLVDLYKVYMDESEVKIKSIDKKNYCFIIDEINRGEMSKIFGELFYSLEPGYRVKIGDLVDSEKREKLVTIRTQYANMNKIANDFDEALKIYDDDDFGHFFVPENVYIIGTMNDIDRSVESMDFAMRRRFAFKEITADERIEMLDSLKCEKKNEAVKCMQALNKEIESISGLSSAYHIGPAYFLKLDNYDGRFEDLWKYHIEGVLHEYLRGMPKAADHLNKLKECYDKSIASESSVSSDNASDSVENS